MRRHSPTNPHVFSDSPGIANEGIFHRFKVGRINECYQIFHSNNDYEDRTGF